MNKSLNMVRQTKSDPYSEVVLKKVVSGPQACQ